MVIRATLALGGAGATRGHACLERRELRVRISGDGGDAWTPLCSEDLFDAHVLSFGCASSSRSRRLPR
jgi:hypothetical protein